MFLVSPKMKEKYITFNKNVLVDSKQNVEEDEKIRYNPKFIDTINFMQTSLEKLVSNMSKPMFKHTTKYFQGELLDLMLRKEIYPYEYMTDISKFNEQNLPPKDEFNSKLSAGVIFRPDTYVSIRDIRQRLQT